MLNLIKNELIKIFRRRNIFILLLIGTVVISTYNLYQKIGNSNVDMSQQYQKVYKNDVFLLENYESLNSKYSYEDIIERVKLEEYAIENNIKYNILLNSKGTSSNLSKDARYLLMQLFNNFDIIIIFIIIYLSTTIISEEYNNGTIKNLLTKPHTRLEILLSKIITNILIIIFLITFIMLLQYLLGGILFGFDSYNLVAIRYNPSFQNIQTMNLCNYMILIIVYKMPMYVSITLISLLFSMITNNIAINILFSLGLYFVSRMENLINRISNFLFVFNWDISTYLFGNINRQHIYTPIAIFSISNFIIFALIIIIFNKKDTKNI